MFYVTRVVMLVRQSHGDSSTTIIGSRLAFTLIEMLVVISIVGMLMSLLLPAVQQARESGRRTTCANHLKQIGLAMLSHESALGVLPSNGGWDGQQQIKSASGAMVEITTTDLSLGQTFTWGVGDPRLGPRTQTGSWAFAILPYLEKRDIYNQRAWTIPVSMYVCPTRRPLEAYAVASGDAYGSYNGAGWTWGKIDYAGNAMVVQNRPRCWAMAEFFDGTSHTVLAGEKAFDPGVQTDMSWYWDEPFFLGGSAGTAREGMVILPDGYGISFKGNWGSRHPGGAQFLFADGGVRLVPFSTPWTRMLAFVTPQGEELVSDLD